MCVAIVKPANTPLPPPDHFKNSFENNPDGAGIAYPTRQGVRIIKGLMTLEAFTVALEGVKKRVNTTYLPMFFHFRIGTHGRKRDPAHTHPFPVIDDYDTMEQLDHYVETAMMHNGIMSNMADHTNRASDSMVFSKEILYSLSQFGGTWHTNPGARSIIDLMIGSNNRVAVLRSNGAWKTYGNWTLDKETLCHYSNTSYCRPKYTTGNWSKTTSRKGATRVLNDHNPYHGHWDDDEWKYGQGGDGGWQKIASTLSQPATVTGPVQQELPLTTPPNKTLLVEEARVTPPSNTFGMPSSWEYLYASEFVEVEGPEGQKVTCQMRDLFPEGYPPRVVTQRSTGAVFYGSADLATGEINWQYAFSITPKASKSWQGGAK